ncbi:MAG TPA: glycoside hydrolase family 5 protein [Bacteroidales bacterium]|nr:glycoside hydrolase family 5 protein [Bacteroidales bacterium]
MKPLFTFLFAISLFFTAITSNAAAPKGSPVAMNGKLSVSGVQLVNEKGSPVMLRGASFGWHNLWPRFYNEKAVAWLADDWKCNVVRASMGVAIEDNYLENPEFALQCMNNVIKGAIKKGVYVLIDFHSHKIHTEEAVKFFQQMAHQYGEYPNIIYEIWNEPDYYTWKEVKEYSEKVIDAIRTIDKDNIILVGSPHWDQDIHEVAADPITGRTNLMYTMHFYAGTHKQWLRDRTDDAMKKGIPIFVSECAGMEASGDGPIDEKEWKAYIDWMESRKISWVAWSVSDKNESCSMLIPRASAEGKWTDDVIKPWGKLTRQTIREKQGN